MQQKLGQILFTPRSWSFWKQHRKGTTRSMPKIKIYIYYIFTENICPTRNATQVVVFCQNVLILQKNDSNFLTLKVA